MSEGVLEPDGEDVVKRLQKAKDAAKDKAKSERERLREQNRRRYEDMEAVWKAFHERQEVYRRMWQEAMDEAKRYAIDRLNEEVEAFAKELDNTSPSKMWAELRGDG